jgi:hypothetical protein
MQLAPADGSMAGQAGGGAGKCFPLTVPCKRGSARIRTGAAQRAAKADGNNQDQDNVMPGLYCPEVFQHVAFFFLNLQKTKPLDGTVQFHIANR